jgi:hypothetical protein
MNSSNVTALPSSPTLPAATLQRPTLTPAAKTATATHVRTNVVPAACLDQRAARASSRSRLFDDFEQPLTLEHVSLVQSPFATYITYRVVR